MPKGFSAGGFIIAWNTNESVKATAQGMGLSLSACNNYAAELRRRGFYLKDHDAATLRPTAEDIARRCAARRTQPIQTPTKKVYFLVRFRWVTPEGERIISRDWVYALDRIEAFKVVRANYAGASDLEYIGERSRASA